MGKFSEDSAPPEAERCGGILPLGAWRAHLALGGSGKPRVRVRMTNLETRARFLVPSARRSNIGWNCSTMLSASLAHFTFFSSALLCVSRPLAYSCYNQAKAAKASSPQYDVEPSLNSALDKTAQPCMYLTPDQVLLMTPNPSQCGTKDTGRCNLAQFPFSGCQIGFPTTLEERIACGLGPDSVSAVSPYAVLIGIISHVHLRS